MVLRRNDYAMANRFNDKIWSYITVIALITWGISLTPFAHFFIAADAKPYASSFFTALLGLGPALKVIKK